MLLLFYKFPAQKQILIQTKMETLTSVDNFDLDFHNHDPLVFYEKLYSLTQYKHTLVKKGRLLKGRTYRYFILEYSTLVYFKTYSNRIPKGRFSI